MAVTPLSSAQLYALIADTLGPNATGSITAEQLDAVLNAIVASYPNMVDGTSAYFSIGTVASGLWHGTSVELPYGGTNANLVAVPGGVVYSTDSQLQISANTPTAGQPLLSGALGTPTWGTAAFPSTAPAGTVLAALTSNTITATSAPVLGANGVAGGSVTLAGATSGSLTLSVPADAGTGTALTFPATSGTTGQIFRLSGTGTASWSAATYPTTILAGQVLAAASANTIAGTYSPTLGVNGVAGGALALAGSTSGSVTIGVPAAAGTGTAFNLPATNGASGSALRSDGSGNASWSTATIPNTAPAGTIFAALTANAVTATPAPVLGANSGTAGTLTLNGSGSTGSVVVGVQSGSLSTSVAFNLPTSNGGGGQILSTDGSGNTSWQSATSLTLDTGSAAMFIAGSIL